MKLGLVQELEIVRITENGVYLSDPADSTTDNTPADRLPEDLTVQRVLLPKNQSPKNAQIGMHLTVFLYKDSEDRPIATTTVPPITLGNTAMLPVKEVTKIGAFLSWGLAKDLLLPFKEQIVRVKAGDGVLVALYIDKSGRLCATSRVYDYLRTDSEYRENDTVTGVVYEIIDAFGAYVAVDNRYSAMIPKQDLFCSLQIGDIVTAHVRRVLPDGKLTLSLRGAAYLELSGDAANIYEKLTAAGGFLPYHDKTDPETIKTVFSLSKNAFKRAVGHLLKEGKITLSDVGIKAVGMDSSLLVKRD
ncbi:MAG: RNA-binding protein [Lachnospiraceae bacterium]|nr:RNA-binding protein [Lachnospiraceae bacterium]